MNPSPDTHASLRTSTQRLFSSKRMSRLVDKNARHIDADDLFQDAWLYFMLSDPEAVRELVEGDPEELTDVRLEELATTFWGKGWGRAMTARRRWLDKPQVFSRDGENVAQVSEPCEESLGPLEGLERTERIALLWNAIHELPEESRPVIEMRGTGLSFREIADELGRKQSTVRVQAHRAIALLRDRLRDSG